MQRDAELVKLYHGEIKPKERRVRKKAAKEAFNNYMKLYFDPGHKVTVSGGNIIQLIIITLSLFTLVFFFHLV